MSHQPDHPVHPVPQWHQQEHADAGAIVVQEFILASRSIPGVTEERLRRIAISKDWCITDVGTPIESIDRLLAFNGLSTMQRPHGTIEELGAQLDANESVVAVIDAVPPWESGASQSDNDPLGSFPGIPGQFATRAVQVVAIDRSDPNQPAIILNDPRSTAGGLRVPLDAFMAAWQSSDNFFVTAVEDTDPDKSKPKDPFDWIIDPPWRPRRSAR